MRSSDFAIICCVVFIAWETICNSSQPCSFSSSQGVYSDPNSNATPSTSKPVGLSRLQRLARYKSRYNYKNPSTLLNHTHKTALCGYGPDYESYFGRSFLERSANDEDRDLFNLFFKNDKDEMGQILTGTMLEMGAFDGIRESNSRFFQECLGWETLLVEGLPRSFQQLVANRPQTHRMNFAPSCSEEEDARNVTVGFQDHPFTNAGLTAVETAYTHVADNVTVQVPCGSLTPVLLDIFPQGHVSLFSLDVEGSEPLVLKNIDFDRVFIEILIVEHNNAYCAEHGKCESRDEFRKILDDNGYIRFTRGISKSDLFIHPLSRHLDTALKERPLLEEYFRFTANRDGPNEIPPHAIW